MKRFRLLGVALAAVFAVGVVLASSASATVTFLLAEWLANGVAVTAELNTITEGTILLEDEQTLAGKSAVICSGVLRGRVGEDGLDVVSEVLNLANELVSSTPLVGLPLECEKETFCEGALVWPENLPWETLLELMEVTPPEPPEIFLVDLLFEGTGGKPAWDIECTTSPLKPSDLCEGEAAIKLTLEGGSLLLAEFNDTFNELAGPALALCTQSNAHSGIVSTVPTQIRLENGETLNASSETMEA
jgi:hypothetical protein